MPYNQWLHEGHLEVCEGWTVDNRYVTDRIENLAGYFNIGEVAFDQWGSPDVVRSLTDHGMDCIQISQQLQAMTAPSKRFESLILENKLVHTGHPILRWNLDCTEVQPDVNGNIKPLKPNSKKSSKRIDGVVALVMAISRVQQAKPKFKSVYSTRGVLTL